MSFETHVFGEDGLFFISNSGSVRNVLSTLDSTDHSYLASWSEGFLETLVIRGLIERFNYPFFNNPSGVSFRITDLGSRILQLLTTSFPEANVCAECNHKIPCLAEQFCMMSFVVKIDVNELVVA